MAIALFSENKLYLYRRWNPIDLLYDKDKKLIWFCSDKDYVKKAYLDFDVYEEGLFYVEYEDNLVERDFDADELYTFDFDKNSWAR